MLSGREKIEIMNNFTYAETKEKDTKVAIR